HAAGKPRAAAREQRAPETAATATAAGRSIDAGAAVAAFGGVAEKRDLVVRGQFAVGVQEDAAAEARAPAAPASGRVHPDRFAVTPVAAAETADATGLSRVAAVAAATTAAAAETTGATGGNARGTTCGTTATTAATRPARAALAPVR